MTKDEAIKTTTAHLAVHRDVAVIYVSWLEALGQAWPNRREAGGRLSLGV